MLELALILFVCACGLLGLAFYRRSAQFTFERRLERIKHDEVQTPEEELNRPFVQRIVLPLADSVARAVRRYTPARTAQRTQERLVMAGLGAHLSAAQLIGLCWFSAVGCALLTITLTASLPHKAQRPLMKIACVVCGIAGGYALPQFVLSRRVRQRQEEILLTLPYAIDILSISVEAGMGFDAAVAYTVRKVKGPLADEFAKTLNEARLGKPRLEALDELGKRTGVDELKIFISAVIHASRLGSSLASTLRIQADTIRVRRRQRVQEQAMKAPVKMVIPLVLFIFPALLIVIVGPAAINMWKHLLR